ncbi:hypothetical protein QYE76_014593 [Lolium multiflorum]|uniref:Integrase catalytic domain-containing protein n=1 Tax=Lolium multiflorum TaxID=4521 RepID=A0AAD8U100_LOLMU|nr:hypothetical protein QYE76_014593 [Lolium multiflorum]
MATEPNSGLLLLQVVIGDHHSDVMNTRKREYFVYDVRSGTPSLTHLPHSGNLGFNQTSLAIVRKCNKRSDNNHDGHGTSEEDDHDCSNCDYVVAAQCHGFGVGLKTIPHPALRRPGGMDMVGKYKTAPGGYTHLLVAVDKFTKWVEAKPIKKCDGKTATKFLRELIYRYGYPHSIITDNGTNFAKGEMADFCEEKGIHSTSPQSPTPSQTAA